MISLLIIIIIIIIIILIIVLTIILNNHTLGFERGCEALGSGGLDFGRSPGLF